jgi:phage terminase large subunit GpA-like protein
MAKEELYRWLRLERPTDEDLEQGIPFPPGYCHFPRYSEEYFKQITAEQLVAKLVKGYRKLEWQKMRERNEALDCRVYARAAAARVGLDRFQEKHWKVVADRMGVPVANAPRPAPQVQAPAAKAAPPARRGRRVSGRFGM